jgi:hypothetical protein
MATEMAALVVCPVLFVVVIVIEAALVIVVGVPVITPVLVFRLRPVGKVPVSEKLVAFVALGVKVTEVFFVIE